MSVFLLVLIAVLVFIPGTLDPFTQGGQDDIVTANRVADHLSEGALGDPSTPHILDTDCTIEFFEDNSPADCRYSGDTLQERVGVLDRTNLNVSLQANLSNPDTSDEEELLCWNGDALNETSDTSASCDTLLAIGETPPNSSDETVEARRVVTVNKSTAPDDKTDVALIVEVW